MKGESWIVVLFAGLMAMLMAGCRPKGILHSWEMRRVLVELHKTDALLQFTGKYQGTTEEKAIYYAQVLERKGITQAEFDSSLVWYTAHPQLFDKIYPKVLAELKAEEEQFRAEHEAELSNEPKEESTPSDKEVPFRKADLDSILWVTQHGYPSSWYPLVHDLEDEFFPQVGVLR